jgi:branched-chain amino acid transport system permease protein
MNMGPKKEGKVPRKNLNVKLRDGYFFHGLVLSGLFMAAYFLLPNPRLATDIVVFGLFAMAYNLTLGHTGLLSMGHSVFLGLSAYVGGMLIVFWQPTIWCLIPAVLAGTLVAFLVACVCFKRMDARMPPMYGLVFLVLITVAFTNIAYYLFVSPLKAWSGGEQGLTGINRELSVFPGVSISFLSPLATHIFVCAVAVACMLAMRGIIRSRLGNLAHAIKGNELRVMFLGHNTFRLKVLIFTISGFFSSVAGALYMIRLGFAGLEIFSLIFVSEAVIMSLIGGRNTVYGPLLGAAIFVSMKHYVSRYTGSWMLIIAMSLVALVLFLPEGILLGVKGMKRRRPVKAPGLVE